MSKTKKQKTYYAITGLNAYGVYTNLEKARTAAKYIVDFKGAKFFDLENAKIWATNTLFSLQSPGDPFPIIAPITRINWLYYREKRRRRFLYDD